MAPVAATISLESRVLRAAPILNTRGMTMSATISLESRVLRAYSARLRARQVAATISLESRVLREEIEVQEQLNKLRHNLFGITGAAGQRQKSIRGRK